MGYIVFCTFDLKNASSQDYQNAYSDLQNIGLSQIQTSSTGSKVVIPTTSVMGEFTGVSRDAVRDDLRSRVKAAFTARKFTSEIFVVVGGDWAWGGATT